MRHTIALFGALAGVAVATWGTPSYAQGDNTAPAPPVAPYTPPPAPAQEQRFVYRQLPAPVNAFEIAVNSGYTQGFGHAAPGLGMPSVAGAGVNGTLNLAYRVNPWVSAGLQGEYVEFVSQQNTAARSVVGNMGVTFHFAPLYRGDPYLRIATGWRGLWSVNPPGSATTLFHGFEIAKLSLGYDIRLSPAVAISPQIGADLTLFVWQDVGGASNALSSAEAATFIYAGLAGRFDMGSTTDTTTVASIIR
jgi:hypothetical protein